MVRLPKLDLPPLRPAARHNAFLPGAFRPRRGDEPDKLPGERRGTYLVQSRGKTEHARYLKLPEAGEDFIVQLAEVKTSLFDIVHEVSIEAWRAFAAVQPAERHEEPETTCDRPPPITT